MQRTWYLSSSSIISIVTRVGSLCARVYQERWLNEVPEDVKVGKQCHQPLGTIDLTFPAVTSCSSNRNGSNVTKNGYARTTLATIQGCRLLYLSRIIYQDEKSLYFTFINRQSSLYITPYIAKISGFVTFLNFLMYRPFSFIIS